MPLDDGLASENLGLVIWVTDVQQPRNQHSGGGGAQALQEAGMEPDLLKVSEATTSLRTSFGCRMAICRAIHAPML